MDVAKNDSNKSIRQKALDKLDELYPNQMANPTIGNDYNQIVDIAKNDIDPKNRISAVKKIKYKDQKLLVDIAKNDPDWDVRLAAVKKIKDESAIVDIAKNDDDYRVREATIIKIKNQAVIEDIAKNDASSRVRLVAVKRIVNQTVLAEIAKNDASSNVCEVAVMKLKNESDLEDMAKNTNVWWTVRETAVKNPHLKNRNVLLDVVKHDPYYERVEERDSYDFSTYKKVYPVRKAANKKLGGNYGKYCWERN